MILELRQDLLGQLLLKTKADKAPDQIHRRTKTRNEFANLLSTGSRVQRGDDIVHESHVKLSGEIQHGLSKCARIKLGTDRNVNAELCTHFHGWRRILDRNEDEKR
jgi:hypothetical protein